MHGSEKTTNITQNSPTLRRTTIPCPAHNLCDKPEKVPKDLIHILGLGLGFCLALPCTHEDKHSPDFHGFNWEVRIKHFFQQRTSQTDPNETDPTSTNEMDPTNTNNTFNKKLHIK